MQPILKLDLSTGKKDTLNVPPEWQAQYLGGASLAARLLYAHLSADLDPFVPEAPLLFLTGPLTGTSGPAVGRFVVCGKSPATGLWAESNCGGFWGPELRFAGYDGLWLTGKADGLVYLSITETGLEVRDAVHLEGLDIYDTQEVVKADLNQPKARVAVIGPAGERQVRFSGIFCDHGRTAGRTGLGAVMGAKNIKAIAVRGTGKIPLADASLFGTLRSEANRALKSELATQVATELGTAGVAVYADYMGGQPKKYYSQGTFDSIDKVSGSTMSETILAGKSACHACVIACGRVVRLEDGEKRKGPEYETIVGFGPNLLNDDLAEITRLGEICDRYGMDVISASNIVGLVYKLFDDGVISADDLDGLTPQWGDTQVAAQLLHKIGRREGVGDLLAEGSLRFAQHFGVGDMAVQVNGLEVAYHDPRGTSGMALVYATSPRGACHNKSDYFLVDWGQAEAELGLDYFDRHAGAEKSINVANHQDFRTMMDALVMCVFANVPLQKMADLVNAATGLALSADDLLISGERAWTLKRAINNRLGLTRDNDCLPKAFLEPYQDGNAVGYIPPLDEMLAAYYAARGWDPKSGRPVRAKLQALGLDDVAQDLWD